MKNYLDLLSEVNDLGAPKPTRTGVDTLSLHGRSLRFNLSDGFPIVTTKRIHFKSVVWELLWLISGSSNIKMMTDNGVTIWNEWADADGNLGPVYGVQWRNWEACNGALYIDQLGKAIHALKNNPFDRRIIVSAWNVGELHNMKLPPCHMMYQFLVRKMKDGMYLDCIMTQRSVDTFLGLPFNISSYALLTHMVAQCVDMKPGEFIWNGHDVHIYDNHKEQVKLQLSREPYPLPTLELNPNIKNIDDFKYDDIKLVNYQYHPSIKAPIAV